MNFKDLEHIASKQAQKTDVSKQSRFNLVFKKGLLLLERAHTEGFNNPETLLSSCDCLIDAITFLRTDIRPYLALAYIFTILEDFKTAEEYAYAAIKLEPDNADVVTFLEALTSFKKVAKQDAAPQNNQPLEIAIPSAPKFSPKAPAEPDCQALYKELEVFILDKVKHLFSSNHSQIVPTVDRKKYTLLEQSLKNLNQVIAYIEQQLKLIEQRLNSSQLRERMMPFTVLKKRYVQALNTSKSLMEINDTIELWSFKTNKQVQVVNQKLTMSALTYGRIDVDRMMDGCDLIADQLDQFSESDNIDISLVESSYEKLLGLVESLNGMVDDKNTVKENQNKLLDILS